MKEVLFDIKNFSYLNGDEADVSFIPMMARRKLNKFGRAALSTIYKIYEGGSPALIFTSEYGDFERVVKLITQRNKEGEVSPSGFSFSVHNASIGLFSFLEKNKERYNSISAGKKTLAYGILESILYGQETIYCYTESVGGLKSLSLLISNNQTGHYLLCGNNEGLPVDDSFEEFLSFMDRQNNVFVSDVFTIKRLQ